jgi:hypothetical protein
MGTAASGTPAGIAGAAGTRVARAAVFAALCVTLSAGAHVLLSAEPLPTPAVAAVFAAVFALALLLAGDRERGYGAIAALLVPSQLAADTVFTTGQTTCYGPGGGPVTGPLRVMGVDLLCSGEVGTPLARWAGSATGDAPLAHTAHPAAPWLLLTAHVAVALAAAAWLRGGEAALARLLRAAAAASFRPLLLAVAFLRPAAASGRPEPAPRVPRPSRVALPIPLLTHSVARRGPPPSAAAAALA